MPCYDSRNDHVASNLIERLDRVTAVACELAKFYRLVQKSGRTDLLLTPATLKWVEEHEELDRTRHERHTYGRAHCNICAGICQVKLNKILSPKEIKRRILKAASRPGF